MPEVPLPDVFDRSAVADALVARQRLDRQTSEELARRIADGDDDIRQAAQVWAETGVFPDEPDIDGNTPASLGLRLSASQVFTGLIALRRQPAVAADLLRYPPPAVSSATLGRQWEVRVRDALEAIPCIDRVLVEPTGPDLHSRPDFVIERDGRRIIVEAKLTPTRIERLRASIDQVERYVLVFEARGGLIVIPERAESTGELTGYLAQVEITSLEHLADRVEALLQPR